MTGCEVTEPRIRCVLPFEAQPGEVRLLRRAVAAQLGLWGLPAATEQAQLAVTELATNVIKHVGVGAAATLILEPSETRLRVEVHDKSHEVPSSMTASCEDEYGRGLHLLAVLAADWGTVLTAAGKSVWCEIPLDPARGCHRIERAVAALEQYQDARGGVPLLRGRRGVGLEESATELIADLLCWIAAQGRDPDDILDRVQMRYEAESAAA